jgi:hypothetical protein
MFFILQGSSFNVSYVLFHKNMYSVSMGKRTNSVGKMKTTHSKKTKKRLEIKKTMLEEKSAKRFTKK